MTEGVREMEKAVATLWDTFSSSPLSDAHNLAEVGLESFSGRSYFFGWDGTGDFHGDSLLSLLREDGSGFLWTVGVLFEQGEAEGQRWQQGCAYAYAGAWLKSDTGAVALYNIGDIQLPTDAFSVFDLPSFAKNVVLLSEKCLDDLDFIISNNCFDAMLDLRWQRVEGHDNWELNPLRSKS
ncbi:hypothetical protein [Deinococcus arenicola]|uniref:Uncharacterized protein n=1 Tax=Deinococcus arenicola TaxID=2994950 RepID=A0ABU4DNA3_9DEIO|nr:hypothetical protein [Deinococcus sp. ZS9-10]MDV6373907.1 hypothetical protein [Deinococcus sp. ZS9-10]